MTSTPGAVMSGLSRSPPPARAGPHEEKPAIVRRAHRRGVRAEIDAVGAGRGGVRLDGCTVDAVDVDASGSSGSRPLSDVGRRLALARTMPTPPASLTAWLLSTRSLVPRVQTTILPATLAGSSTVARPRSLREAEVGRGARLAPADSRVGRRISGLLGTAGRTPTPL